LACIFRKSFTFSIIARFRSSIASTSFAGSFFIFFEISRQLDPFAKKRLHKFFLDIAPVPDELSKQAFSQLVNHFFVAAIHISWSQRKIGGFTVPDAAGPIEPPLGAFALGGGAFKTFSCFSLWMPQTPIVADPVKLVPAHSANVEVATDMYNGMAAYFTSSRNRL